MSVRDNTKRILEELQRNTAYLDDTQLSEAADEIPKAGQIFPAGAGRSGLMIKAFTNRLMHLGLSVSNVGEITSPHTKAGDLLLIGSGSGETDSLISMARKAAAAHVRILLFTMDGASSIAKMADTVVVLPGVSPKTVHQGLPIASVQPMGSAYEQMNLIVYDAIIMELMDRMGENAEEMFARHADLE